MCWPQTSFEIGWCQQWTHVFCNLLHTTIKLAFATLVYDLKNSYISIVDFSFSKSESSTWIRTCYIFLNIIHAIWSFGF
jgi:hypothetical protein